MAARVTWWGYGAVLAFAALAGCEGRTEMRGSASNDAGSHLESPTKDAATVARSRDAGARETGNALEADVPQPDAAAMDAGTVPKAEAGGTPRDASPPTPTCPSGSLSCGGVCIDVAYDPKNCGGCGIACGLGELCSAGQCGTTCFGGSLACAGRCVDPENDPANCGGCGKACDVGTICSRGSCVLGCAGGTVECHGRCADTANDPTACGACDAACVVGEYCSAGQCTPLCTAPFELCDGKCTDTTSNHDNCGSCGSVCPTDQVCSNGACALECTGGTTKCGDACVTTSSDPANCGSCGNGCGTGQYCSNGTCAGCGTGLASCNGQCEDLQTSDSNCGRCGNACPYTYYGYETCVSGTCTANCYNGYVSCGSSICSVNTSTDRNNCGACGVVCGADQACTSGVCTSCGTGKTMCSGYCVDVQTDTQNCGSCGNYCNYRSSATASCVAGTCTWTCIQPYADCNGNSTDGCEVYTSSDRKNCGACGTACAADQVCSQGTCANCISGRTQCSNACVDLQSDSQNCGACGVVCNAYVANASSACAKGSCGLKCNTGFLDCDGNDLDGCETRVDGKNCGACGTACASGELCASAKCIACSPTDLGTNVPLSVSDSTAGHSDSFTTTCGYTGRADAYYSFTAPEAKTYTIQVNSAFAYAVVEAHDGSCSGASLGCAMGYPSATLTLSLSLNQTIVIVVENTYYDTSFTLQVN